MHFNLFADILIILGISLISVFVCNKIKIPPIVGFLVTGIIVGPFGFGFINSLHDVEIFGEIGVVFLLFTIGIEFSLSKLLKMKKNILIGGSIQVLLSISFVFGLGFLFGLDYSLSIFMGFLVSLSSTAIVLKILQSKTQIESPQGRISLSILIFQDIIIVPMILLTPILAGKSENPFQSLLILVPKFLIIIILTFLLSKWIIPKLLFQITKTKIRELFILVIVFICLIIVFATYSLGLSLSLGAFLAGLIISESDYSVDALGNILPFKDLFTSFFFVSIGMMLNLQFVTENIVIIIFLLIMILLLKTFSGFIATIILKYPLRTAILVGFALFQIGEFSFILAKTGLDMNFLSNYYYQLFLSLAVFTLAITPFIIDLSPYIAKFTTKIFSKKYKFKEEYEDDANIIIENHIIIIGYGINGKNISKAAKFAQIPYIIIEMNPVTVRNEKSNGEPIIYGDATNYSVLEHSHIESARIAVIAISDPASTRNIIYSIKKKNPNIYLIVRTRFFNEMQELYELGADEVIPEEFETSIEIFARVLTKYFISDDQIDKLVSEIRAEGYQMFRSITNRKYKYDSLKFQIPDFNIHNFKIDKNSKIINHSIQDIKIRELYGLTIIAIKRNNEIIAPPPNDIVFKLDDVLILFGKNENFQESLKLLK